jgi:hypothetical protein
MAAREEGLLTGKIQSRDAPTHGAQTKRPIKRTYRRLIGLFLLLYLFFDENEPERVLVLGLLTDFDL